MPYLRKDDFTKEALDKGIWDNLLESLFEERPSAADDQPIDEIEVIVDGWC